MADPTKSVYGIVEELPSGRIRQIGMTEQQRGLLLIAIAAISEVSPLVQMPEASDLVLKNNI